MSGRLNDGAMERAIQALQACAARVARRPMRGLRAVATEACRQAENGPAFLHRVREATGLSIDIISPREEAELALESCAPLLTGGGRRALVFDIGGGSTELSWVRLDGVGVPELIGYASLPMGVVTLVRAIRRFAMFEPGRLRQRCRRRRAADDRVREACIASGMRCGWAA